MYYEEIDSPLLEFYDDAPVQQSAQDAVFSLVEELYQAKNAINEERIHEAMKALCSRFGVPLYHIEDYDLNIKHTR
jgi:hypothetical protein